MILGSSIATHTQGIYWSGSIQPKRVNLSLYVSRYPLRDIKLTIYKVLIDHGLYIDLPKSFREEYCTLWRSLFVLDVKSIENIAHKWGIALDANM